MQTSLIEKLRSMAARWERDGGLCERDDCLAAIAEIERLRHFAPLCDSAKDAEIARLTAERDAAVKRAEDAEKVVGAAQVVVAEQSEDIHDVNESFATTTPQAMRMLIQALAALDAAKEAPPVAGLGQTTGGG